MRAVMVLLELNLPLPYDAFGAGALKGCASVLKTPRSAVSNNQTLLVKVYVHSSRLM